MFPGGTTANNGVDTSLAKQAPSSTPAGSITIVGPTASNGNISGQIVDSNNQPVEGAAVRMSGTQNRLTVTDAAGNYRFDNVETNGFYTVAPSRASCSLLAAALAVPKKMPVEELERPRPAAAVCGRCCSESCNEASD